MSLPGTGPYWPPQLVADGQQAARTRRQAVRHVCSRATDGKDAARLLAALGLDPEDGR